MGIRANLIYGAKPRYFQYEVTSIWISLDEVRMDYQATY